MTGKKKEVLNKTENIIIIYNIYFNIFSLKRNIALSHWLDYKLIIADKF